NSDLILRILSDDKDDVMPPPKSNRHLTDAQKQLLKRWVQEGAPWGEHWAFIAPKRPAVPAAESIQSSVSSVQSGTAAAGSPLNTENRILNTASPIDTFIRARLAKENISPAPEADRATLLRRVTLDLTGLPPTPE